MRCSAFVCALLLFAANAAAMDVRISVDEPSGVRREGWPVTSGVPLPEGALDHPENSALLDATGRELPLQTEALARWPDGSVRWLLLDFQADLAPRERKTLLLRCGPEVRRAAVDKPVRAYTDDGAVVLDTGPLLIRLPQRGLSLLDNVQLDVDGDGRFAPDERITAADSAGVVLADDGGRRFQSAAGPVEAEVEQAGPLRACVRLTGRHTSEQGETFRSIVRIHAFRGRPFVRCFYTFVNDSQESLMAKLSELELVFSLSPQAGAARTAVLDARENSGRRVFQADELHYEVDGAPVGRRAAGWGAVGGQKAGLAAGLREFWQNWPKSVEVRDGRLALGICPRLPPGLYSDKPLEEENKLYYQLRDGFHTFKVGVARTHEFWATFFGGRPDSKRLGELFRAAEAPLLAVCQSEYVSETKALGEFPAADESKYFGYDAWLRRAFKAHLALRDRTREYGMLNYGDWYGERKVNWGNLEYDLAHGLFLQYLRTGDRRYFARAEQAARHHIDVDVVHATNPYLKNPWGPAPQVGEIWLHCLNHTGGYYDNAPLPVSRTYQMGHSTNFGHVWVTGDLDYYYLTGDRRARDVSIQVADAMVRHCPTSYGTHIRTLGWPTILVLAAYEATGDEKYLKAAEANWRVLKKNIDWDRGWVVRLAGDHCRHGDRRCYGNVPFMEGLMLCSLVRYHRITQDPEVLRAISVGVDQMIRECWQEDVKTFRYTACPLSSKTPYALFMLSTEAMAYEAALTGDAEHLRILREGVRAAIPRDDGCHFGKTFAQMIYFTPYGLSALEK